MTHISNRNMLQNSRLDVSLEEEDSALFRMYAVLTC